VRGVKAVAEMDLAWPDVSTRGQALSSRPFVDWALDVHEVSHLESEASPGG